ncbi:MAG: flavin reductase family protein [Rhizobacter sp.]|nr:flavin reductase family protein [Rhizobacter sp.]
MFSPQEFRSALGHFATGVTVVTCRDPEFGLIGLTASSFNSVSLAPPLVLWSLAHTAASSPALKRGTHYAINVLAADQQCLAERFARKNVDRFAGIPWRTGICGAPILDGVAAVFECFNRSRYEEGDHTIFVGEVERCERRDDAEPLVFHAGRFCTALAR